MYIYVEWCVIAFHDISPIFPDPISTLPVYSCSSFHGFSTFHGPEEEPGAAVSIIHDKMSSNLSGSIINWSMPPEFLPLGKKVSLEHIDKYKDEIYLLDEDQRNLLGQPVQMLFININDPGGVARATNIINDAKMKLQNIGKTFLGLEMASRAKNLGLKHITTSKSGDVLSSQDPSCGQHVIEIFTSEQMKTLLIENPNSYFKMYYYAVLSVPLTGNNYKKSAIEEFKRVHFPFLNTDQLTRFDDKKKQHCMLNLLGNPIAKYFAEVIRTFCKQHAQAYIVVKVTKVPKNSNAPIWKIAVSTLGN